jgi:hypothetical protein
MPLCRPARVSSESHQRCLCFNVLFGARWDDLYAPARPILHAPIAEGFASGAHNKAHLGRKLQGRQAGPLAKGGGRGAGGGAGNAGSSIAWGQYALNSDFPYIAAL